MTMMMAGAGILTSLIATVLFVCGQRVWSHHVSAQKEKGVGIDGPWTTEIVFPDGQKNVHWIKLKSDGPDVEGTAICTDGWGGGKFTYKVTGTFKNMILTAEYEIVGDRRFERGALALMLVDGGAKLKGHLVYLDNEGHRIETVPCEWLAKDVPSPMED